MSLLYSVVFATRCRSNHHRLAVDALRHLRDPASADWRTLFLHHHAEYLAGAKAPDEQFKDFKNHVLHVRDGDWGGAPDACAEWQRRTVRALAAKDWAMAAWSAGVMSHYYVDPIQPFHTHQTEEEGVIHRAVEWSFSKSYGAFQALLEGELGGYPDVAVPEGDDWLREMVRQGARVSNPHYETVIDHYDFAKGVKDPPAGLDEELKRVVARLVGHAAVGLSRILDRTFAEAAVAPPKVAGDLRGFFLALEIPIQMTLKLIDDVAARREVAAQFEEFQRTGKVRATLGEDDKVVRRLFAAEVLKTPLSSLDAQWPREIGTKAGQGAQPVAKLSAKKAAPVDAARAGLDANAPVVDAPAIGAKTAARLSEIGVATIADLLAASPEETQAKLGAKHISAGQVRDWQAQATLACAVSGLKSREAQALVACGVRDAQALAGADAAALASKLAAWAKSGEAKRIWGDAAAPSAADVAGWQARLGGAGLKAA